ncbi:UDP-N-acetylmuramoyl-L-alanine--D-glutamate ligase [Lentibacillus sp. JNUCC-1]|uniref:UDP-N-acetylmuramoyl-L-alanine--D-glutamate ligase n=1 Tax=Lentibacillus sp. JNUCC-1 TaxID=2654513 RepID=UPI0012E79616|nr:UDP-N-acetylmuramoyl-L-alanine--D-glutamate ligase [Lentibacillus sp. JNUCC-1]MUV36220.1 UDP-N-acetylmuramoyl-L-alanine--D-glutamate ligase [Lentibacillus sp. JNUCC-1]
MKFQEDFPYNHILILGLARSGTAAAEFLLQANKNVRINDLKAENHEAISKLEKLGAELVIGTHPISVLDQVEVIIKTPGIPYENPVLKEALIRGIPIITEVELAGYMTEGPIIGITGSNGKTTTTTLIGEMLQAADQHPKVAGNIGVAATEMVQQMTTGDKLVLELSSFQLAGTATFKPDIAVLLNLYEAHLDYHKTFAHYVEAKSRIFANQTSNDYLIYNADQAIVKDTIQNAKATCVPFSMHTRQGEGAWTDQVYIYFKEEQIMPVEEMVLVGSHNLENILAAVAVAKISGVNNEAIKHVLKTFKGIPHRLQFIGNVNHCKYFNDSKATNILAAKKALASFKQPTIWLAGGLDRGQTFDELLPSLKNVKALIAFGETRQKLADLAKKAGIDNIALAEDVTDAVTTAYDYATHEDIVLLSPACASWDQYKTFEERGDMFIQAVHRLM